MRPDARATLDPASDVEIFLGQGATLEQRNEAGTDLGLYEFREPRAGLLEDGPARCRVDGMGQGQAEPLHGQFGLPAMRFRTSRQCAVAGNTQAVRAVDHEAIESRALEERLVLLVEADRRSILALETQSLLVQGLPGTVQRIQLRQEAGNRAARRPRRPVRQA